ARRTPSPVVSPQSKPGTIFLHSDYCDLVIPSSAFTLSGFRAWVLSADFPGRGRISFLDGEVFVQMSPEELRAHGTVKIEVTSVVYRLVKTEDWGEVYPDRTLLSNDQVELSTEPDACFASYETLESGRAREVPLVDDATRSKEIQGTPDWVLEIVSDSSV